MATMISNADGARSVTVGNTKGISSSGAAFVSYGYGQVEPNHLSAQRTAQIYAQLPAASDIEKLENGQFIKYSVADGVCNFTGAGEWMLVYNEVKVYHDRDTDADFAMIKGNYVGRVYNAANEAMPAGTNMVPRLFKTNVGDMMTTNTVDVLPNTDDVTHLAKGDILMVDPASGFLVKTADTAVEGTPGEGDTVLKVAPGMQWQVAKVYTLGDRQPAVKVVRVQ